VGSSIKRLVGCIHVEWRGASGNCCGDSTEACDDWLECSSGEGDSTGVLRFTGMDKGVCFLMKRRLRTKTLPL